MSEAFTEDTFLNGKVTVFQPAKGFRAGMDSVLLAAALDADMEGDALEVGCGPGGALYPAAIRLRKTLFAGIEKDPWAFELAERGLVANQMEGRVQLIHGDAGNMPNIWQNRFDIVFSNPPYFSEGTIRAPSEGKTAAYVESLPLKDWINAMLFALRPKGTFVMIHRAAELARILAVIERQVGEITVLPVRPYPNAEAKRVIVRARKGLRSGPMRLLSGIDLYDAKGSAQSEAARAIISDGAGLNWA